MDINMAVISGDISDVSFVKGSFMSDDRIVVQVAMTSEGGWRVDHANAWFVPTDELRELLADYSEKRAWIVGKVQMRGSEVRIFGQTIEVKPR